MAPIPIGLCGCGCGRETKIATKTVKKIGHVRGEPLRFVNGHNRSVILAALRAQMEPPNPSGLCFCGCGQRTNSATTTQRATGDVKDQPRRYASGHQSRSKLSLRDRFEQYVYPDPNSGCFIWVGTTDIDGYGVFHYLGRQRFAHHVAWLLAGRELPRGGLALRHKTCDQRCCVNIDHLVPGTPYENAEDMALRGRGTKSRAGLPYGVSRTAAGTFQSRLCVDRRTAAFGTYALKEQAHAVAVFVRDVSRGIRGMIDA